MRQAPTQEWQLSCVDLDDMGLGIGQLSDGDETLVVHVPGGLPGEKLSICIVHRSPHMVEGQRHAWAILRSILSASPDRLSPACQQQGICGGCALMPLAYSAQLSWKQQRVKRQLIAYANLANMEVDPCHPSRLRMGYRNHAKYIFGFPPGMSLPVLGAYAPRSHTVVDQCGCVVVEPILEKTREALLPILRRLSVAPYHESTRTGLLRYVIMRATTRGEVLVTYVIGQNEWPDAKDAAQWLVNQCPWVAGVLLNINREPGNTLLGSEERGLIGQTQIDDRIGTIPVRLAARSFFQTNRELALQLYSALKEAASRQAPFNQIVDVYAGAGGIALSLADLGEEVIAIEENPATTQAAQAFLLQQNHPLRFLTGDAAACLREINQADLVVLNPPRKGCTEAVLSRVLALHPRLLMYMSCDPETLARDLSRLVQDGMVLSSVRPFDMMPQTPHVETLAILVKETNPVQKVSKD